MATICEPKMTPLNFTLASTAALLSVMAVWKFVGDLLYPIFDLGDPRVLVEAEQSTLRIVVTDILLFSMFVGAQMLLHRYCTQFGSLFRSIYAITSSITILVRSSNLILDCYTKFNHLSHKTVVNTLLAVPSNDCMVHS